MMMKSVIIKSTVFTMLSVYLAVIMAGSFSSLLHRVSHDLQGLISGVENTEVHHHHSHSHADHHHFDHGHPLLDFLKEVSKENDAPAPSPDTKKVNLAFHFLLDESTDQLALTDDSTDLQVPFQAILLDGYSGIVTPPPRG